MKISEVFEANPDGFSIDVNSEKLYIINKGDYKKGYLVAITDNKTNKDNIETLFNLLLKFCNKLNTKSFIGGWREGENFYLDVCVYARNEDEAMYLKSIFNQKAIFDLNRFEVC